MIKQKNTRLKIILIIVFAFALIALPNGVSADVKPIAEVQDKLKGISEEERTILGNLFMLTQEIEGTEREEAKVTKDIEGLKVEIGTLENRIKNQQQDYDDKLEILELTLVSYQKSGPASYIETLLNAENLTSFLRSINIIRDFSRNVGELLDSVEKDKKKLSEEKDKLSKSVALQEEKKKSLQESLAKKQKLKKDQEAYLDSFKEKRGHYETQLNNLEQMWDEIKIVFSDIVGDFGKIVKGGSFPQKALNLKFNLPVVKGTIHEETFNDIFKKNSNLPEMIFHFYEDKIKIEVPEKHLVLDGTFIIQGKSVLKLKVKEGSFYGMPLESASIEELFRNGDLIIDIKDLAGDKLIFDISLKSIKIMDGYLDFEVRAGI